MAQKIRTGLALIVVFLLVLATNMIDNQHFATIQKSVESIYEDRLVAKGYLYKISRKLQIKRDVLRSSNSGNLLRLNAAANDSIQILVDRFAATKLTGEEAKRLESLRKNLQQLLTRETSLKGEVNLGDELPLSDDFEHYFAKVTEDLDALSEIQLSEGRREKIISTRAVDTSNLISKIEIAFLILIGFLLQLLIFVKPLK